MGVTFIMERRPIQVLDPHCRFTDIGTAAGAPPVGAVDRAASTQEGGLFRYPFQRLQGDLLLGQAGNGSTAEACYQRALRVARAQQTRSLELRAATSLARLWANQGAAPRRANCSLRFTADSPWASTPPT